MSTLTTYHFHYHCHIYYYIIILYLLLYIIYYYIVIVNIIISIVTTTEDIIAVTIAIILVIIPHCCRCNYLRTLIILSTTTAPDVPPGDVKGYNTSSTSIRVSWDAVSLSHLRGIHRGYRIFYIERLVFHPSRIMRNTTVDSNTLEADLTGLQKFTDYIIFVVAFSSRDGLSSNTTIVKTDEDSK